MKDEDNINLRRHNKKLKKRKVAQNQVSRTKEAR